MTPAQTGDLFLHFDPQGDLLQATLDCETDVFVDRYGEDAVALEGYHAPYAGSSTFLSLADASGYVVAMSRLVFPGPAGLITLVDLADEPWGVDADSCLARTGLDPARTWDISAVCVRNPSRGRTALYAAAIYHGLIKTAQVNQVQGFVAVMDDRVIRILRMLGLVVHPIPGTTTQPFWGSPATTPAWANFADFVSGQRRLEPDTYRLVTLGVGLDGIRVPPLDAFQLHRPRSVGLPHGALGEVDLSAHRELVYRA